jgi:hypothetical protein
MLSSKIYRPRRFSPKKVTDTLAAKKNNAARRALTAILKPFTI